MNERKLTNDEKRDWLLENCVNDNGDLVICGIDLSKFKGKVVLIGWKIGGNADLSSWEVKGNLDQHYQKVNGDLYQDYHIVNGDLYQQCQKVNGNLEQSYQIAENLNQSYQSAENLNQSYQNVSKDLVSQKLKEDEEWVDFQGSDCAVIRTKKLKEISLDELAKMGYKLKEK